MTSPVCPYHHRQNPSALLLASLITCQSAYASVVGTTHLDHSTPPAPWMGLISRLLSSPAAGHSSSLQGWPLSAVSWSKKGSFELSSVLLTQFVFLYTNVFLSPCQESCLISSN